MNRTDACLAALEPALGDVGRALERDRSHVVVAGGSHSERSRMLQAIPARLAAPLRAVAVSLRGADAPDVCGRILAGLGHEIGSWPEQELRDLVADLEAAGQVLVLLIDDAGALHPDVLARLGAVVAAAQPQLLLVLGVGSRDPDATDAAEVVRDLGLGAQKVELDVEVQRVPAPTPRVPPSELPPLSAATARVRPPALLARPAAPPRIRPPAPSASPATPLGRPEPAAGPAPRRPRAARPTPAVAAAAAVGGLALLSAVAPWHRMAEHLPRVRAELPAALEELPAVGTAPESFLEKLRSATPESGRPLGEADTDGAEAPADAATAEAPAPATVLAMTEPQAPAEIAPEPSAPEALPSAPAGVAPEALPSAPAGVAPEALPSAPAGVAPEALPSAPVETRAQPEPPAPRPVRTVSVSLNARPWARIEVDGRDIGITPLAGLPLSRGSHRFRARFEDGRVIDRTVHIDSQQNRVVFP